MFIISLEMRGERGVVQSAAEERSAQRELRESQAAADDPLCYLFRLTG